MQQQQKYIRLMEALKAQIMTGEIAPGARLPSEHTLAEQNKVSRHTVRKSLSILENEGLVRPVHGKGTFCCERMGPKRATKNIAVITTYLDSYIFPRLIQGIDRVLTGAGYSILIKNTKNSRRLEEKYLEELLQKGIDGLMIEPSKSQIFCRHLHLYEKLDAYGIPYVFIQGCFRQLSHKPHVLLDDAGGGYTVTRYLISRGCKDVLGIFKADDAQGQQRHIGYVKALQEAGMLYDPEKVIWFYTEDRTLQPYQQMKQRAKTRDSSFFDGVVCYNDQIAIEAIRALQESGISVPSEVSVTGFDDSDLAKYGRIPLTTIVHPKELLGECAAELLLSLLPGEQNKGASLGAKNFPAAPKKDASTKAGEHPKTKQEQAGPQIILPARLAIRESTR